MLPNINSIIDRFSSAFRIEQRIDADNMLLITESYLGTRLLYAHELPLEPLYELLSARLLNDLSNSVDTHPSEK